MRSPKQKAPLENKPSLVGVYKSQTLPLTGIYAKTPSGSYSVFKIKVGVLFCFVVCIDLSTLCAEAEIAAANSVRFQGRGISRQSEGQNQEFPSQTPSAPAITKLQLGRTTQLYTRLS